MDSLGIRQAAASDLTAAGNVPVKTSALRIRRVVDPRKFLGLYYAVPVVIRKLLKGRIGSLPAPAPTFFSPSIRLDFGKQPFLPKNLAQMQWA
jgi:hypothetical protein